MVRGEGLRRWRCAALGLALACSKEVKVVQKAVTGVEPQVAATVLTIQTNLQPQNKSFTHSIVIANGHARSGDEVDRWRLFDVDNMKPRVNNPAVFPLRIGGRFRRRSPPACRPCAGHYRSS